MRLKKLFQLPQVRQVRFDFTKDPIVAELDVEVCNALRTLTADGPQVQDIASRLLTFVTNNVTPQFVITQLGLDVTEVDE